MAWSFLRLAVASLLLHAGFLIYGHFQDQHPVVKFTDVDYLVFTDGARFVTAGESPYLRATYRYTPLLAWLVVPNVVWHPDFGKWLFCACDLLGGWFIHAILCRVGCAPDRATKYTAVWLLNPFVVAISARGNSESVITVLVLGALWALMTGRQNLGGILYGISVHFKIYPIVYALPFWLYLDSNYPCKSASLLREYSGGNGGTSTAGRAPLLGVRKGLGEFFSWRRLQFAILSGGVFLLLTAGMYYLYGFEFLHESYLYHITRKDHRHNFSVYFYHMYLSSGTAGSQDIVRSAVSSRISALLSFLPQLGLVALLGGVLAKDLALACFAQTFAFVMLNKVCTSQYFMWYLCLLPLILPSSALLQSHRREGLLLLIAWVLGQALWLSQAYGLEHLGLNKFRELWVAGVIFYLVNAIILARIIRHHQTLTSVGTSVEQVTGTDSSRKTKTSEPSSEKRTSLPMLEPFQSAACRNLEEINVGQNVTEFRVRPVGSSWVRPFDVATALSFLPAILKYVSGTTELQSLCYLLIPAVLLLIGLYDVRQESIVFMRTLGISITTTSRLGLKSNRFIPLHDVAGLIINEGIRRLTVRYYLAVVVKGEASLVVVFENTLPRLDVLRVVHKCGNQILWGDALDQETTVGQPSF